MSGAALALAPGQKAAAPAPAGLAQRRCACGGVVGPSGECAACRRKRLLGRASGSLARRTAEDAPELERDERVGGVVATHALACYGTGAVSVCNVDTGNYDITGNANTCCTRDCSQQHEQRHVTDLGDCCRALHDRVAAGGNRGSLIDQFNEWMETDGAHPWSECNAYGVSTDCGRALATRNSCSPGTTPPSPCCTEIADYQSSMAAQHTSWCGRAPRIRPVCPFKKPQYNDAPGFRLPPGEAYA